MSDKKVVKPKELARLAQKYRKAAGKRRADAARDMGVRQTSIFHAEESPDKPYLKLRIRMIERYSSCKVTGPVFMLEKS